MCVQEKGGRYGPRLNRRLRKMCRAIDESLEWGSLGGGGGNRGYSQSHTSDAGISAGRTADNRGGSEI